MTVDKVGLGDLRTDCADCGVAAVGVCGSEETDDTEEARLRELQIASSSTLSGGGLMFVNEERCLIGLGGRTRQDMAENEKR